jgi:hypothetical protein
MRRGTFRGAAGFALALFIIAAGTAGATVMIREDLDTLTRQSDVIVRGKVTRLASRWTADHRRIVTDVDIEVSESLKGAPATVVRVTQPGGEVGDIGQRVSGLAVFSPGEEVVVFLQRRPGEGYAVEGLAQGKFRVERSSDGTRAFAVPEPTGDALVLDAATRQPIQVESRVRELEDLRREVRAALNRKRSP